ncbi:MAG: HAD-IIA family hydrolase [Thermomicrobiales bacterium]
MNPTPLGETAQTPKDLPSHEKNARLRLRAAKAWIFDMDGVLYRGSEPLPGVSDLLNALDLRERPYMLATNNSMSTAAEYVTKLMAMDIVVPEASILTSAMATRDYLRETFPPDAGIFVVGMPALRAQLFDGSTFHTVQYGEETPAAVVVGLDKAFTYEKLSMANEAIRAGAKFIATNTDATLPTERGLIPGAGSIVAAIATATGVAPTVIGKPEPVMLDIALHRMGIAPEDAVMIGDRLDTDIAAGHRTGMLTVLVLTGVSQRDEVALSPILPDLVMTDLHAVLEALIVDTP